MKFLLKLQIVSSYISNGQLANAKTLLDKTKLQTKSRTLVNLTALKLLEDTLSKSKTE